MSVAFAIKNKTITGCILAEDINFFEGAAKRSSRYMAGFEIWHDLAQYNTRDVLVEYRFPVEVVKNLDFDDYPWLEFQYIYSIEQVD